MIDFIYNNVELANSLNVTGVESIIINGLFKKYDIEIDLKKNVNIMIGENGLGKTTILNCIYYLLSKKVEKLANIEFAKIQIKFSNSSPLEISKNDIIAYVDNSNEKSYKHWLESDIVSELKRILMFENRGGMMNDVAKDLDYIAYKISRKYDIPSRIAEKYIIKYIIDNQNRMTENKSRGKKVNVEKIYKAISHNVKNKIIYLPTYRRIEDDYSELNLIIKGKKDSDLLIQFGMSDVQKSIDSILDTIRTIAAQNFTNMSGVLLKQYLDNREHFDNKIYERIDANTAKIILDRIGDKIDFEDKGKILKIIHENDYRENLYLLNLIKELKKNYDSQRVYDEKINRFVETCNNYMIDKHIEYNPSTLSVNIFMDNAKKRKNEIKLMNLSSGEKQIVSLFSKLYLENDHPCIMIIDEPELSLSIEWQRKILPDIIRSDNCALLIAVTHSPFVFDNEFDKCTYSMRELIKSSI